MARNLAIACSMHTTSGYGTKKSCLWLSNMLLEAVCKRPSIFISCQGACPVPLPQRRWRLQMMRSTAAESGGAQSSGSSSGASPEEVFKQLLQQQGSTSTSVRQLMQQQQRDNPWYAPLP